MVMIVVCQNHNLTNGECKGVMYDNGAAPMTANIVYQKICAKKIHTIYSSVSFVSSKLSVGQPPPCEALKTSKKEANNYL